MNTEDVLEILFSIIKFIRLYGKVGLLSKIVIFESKMSFG